MRILIERSKFFRTIGKKTEDRLKVVYTCRLGLELGSVPSDKSFPLLKVIESAMNKKENKTRK